MFAQFTEEEFAGNGHRKENFIVQCLFNRQPCDAGSFHTFRHFLNGNCFTFNSIMRQNDERAAALELNDFGMKVYQVFFSYAIVA